MFHVLWNSVDDLLFMDEKWLKKKNQEIDHLSFEVCLFETA